MSRKNEIGSGKVGMDTFSKVSELLADFAQAVAHQVYCNESGKKFAPIEFNGAKDILRRDLLSIIDEFVDKRSLYQEAINEYCNEANKRLHYNKRELASNVDLIIRKRVEHFYETFEAYVDKSFEKITERRIVNAYEKQIKLLQEEMESKLTRMEKMQSLINKLSERVMAMEDKLKPVESVEKKAVRKRKK